MGDLELDVSGGAGGMDARLEDLATLARNSDDLALALGGISAECHTMLVDPDLVASAVLDPGGVAKFTTTLLGALDGPDGVTNLGVRLAQRAVVLRGLAVSYEAMDEANRLAIDSVRWIAGYAAAQAAPLTVLLALYPLKMYVDNPILAELFITEHPGIVDSLVGAGPGTIAGLSGENVYSVSGAAAYIARFYPDGNPLVTDLGVDTGSTVTRNPPDSFGDLLDGLDRRDAVGEGDPDRIDIRVITHPDGTKAYVVDIPGTKNWNAPLSFNSLPNDLGTNMHAMGDDWTTRQRGIAEALRLAGASSTDPVMLVGHSQGGILAAQAAHDSGTKEFDFNVTHVMTAGAPIARIDIPDGVQVIALENSHDIVPHLDAADNRDRPNVTTVTFDTQHGTYGDNHGIKQSYLAAAQAMDTSTDPSVTAYKASAEAFIGTENSKQQTNVYSVTRVP